ncbi:MAG TPA: hypothetical protein VFQ14_05580 [Thermoleophilaceae bacterium]|nr:hypothetical protein [Thermoleophilaceae bacterium]
MIERASQLLCLLAALAALAVAGCGGDDEPQGEKLPPEITKTLQQQLESVGDRVAAGVSGACDDIYSTDPDVGNIGAIDEALGSIPQDVDPEIRSALDQSIQRLNQLVDQECGEIRAAEQDRQDTVTDETTPTETIPTDTETVPTETTETTTTPPETTPTTPVAPPSGVGPDGDGPPGQDRGGAEAPDGGGD